MKILLANFTKMVDDSGGLAKVTANFANEMTKRGHEVVLIYSDEKTGNFFYPVNDNVKCYDLRHYNGKSIDFPLYMKAKREILRTFSKIKARTVNNDFTKKYLLGNLKELLNVIKPDIIVSFQPAASKALICDLKVDIPVITMSHGDPEDYFHIYPLEEIPAVEKSTINQVLIPSFEEHIKNHLPNAKTITIGNAIPQFDFSADLSANKDFYKIIFVGRLNKNHKRPHLLIEAFAKLSSKYPNWIVELWGAPDKKAYFLELEHLIKSNNLEKKVFLKGSTDKVPQVLKDADIFAFPSAYEGFGMALAEGMSVGLPGVGFRSCPAVNELIKDGKTGILCDDGAEGLALALNKLMGNQQLRIKMGIAAKADMAEYSPQKIWDKWEDLLKKSAINKNR